MSNKIKLVLSFGIFLILFIGYFHKVNAINQDLGRHLLLGKIILQTHNVPTTNLFSYTYPNFPFINHHWFSEVIFYLIFNISGYNGLLILSIAIVLTAFFLIFLFSSKRTSLISLCLVSLLYLRVLFERTELRPEIFSFLFLSIFIVILYKYKEKFTKLIFILPLIELLWVNIHIYFFIGIAVFGLFWIDFLVSHRKKIFQSPAKILSLIFILTIAVTLFNPNFISGALYPFRVFGNYGYQIEENQNIFFLWNLFQKATVPYLVAAIFLLFSVLILKIKNTKLIDWFLAVFFSVLSIVAVRNFPLFVFGTIFISAKCLSLFFENKIFNKKTVNILPIVIIFITLWQITQIFNPLKFGFGEYSEVKNGADFFLQNNLKGPIFNNFNIGSYLDYRFYPKEKVFVDGRPEAYPADFFKNIYVPMQENPRFFEEIDKKYKFQTIFFSHTDQTPWSAIFLRGIANNKNWKMIYLDNFVVIFQKKAINNIPFTLREYESDVYSLYSLSGFYQKVGREEKEIQVHQKILSLDGKFCPSLYRLAFLYSQKNDPVSSVYSTKLQNFCQ